MKKSIKILLTMLLTIILSGCIIQAPSNEDYIDIKKLYNENKEVIDKVVAHIDIKTAAAKFDFEYNSNDIYLENKFSLMSLKKIDGIRIKFERILYFETNHYAVLMCEMKNEQAAKEIWEKYTFSNPGIPAFYKKNVFYFNEIVFNLMMGNFYVEDNNYVTLDGKVFLTNLSNNQVIYVPDVKEITNESCIFHTNIKKIYVNINLEKINYGAFYGCFNLQNVYLNDGLKEICEYSFYACESLKYVVIPESVEKIGKHAFSHGIIYCEALEKPQEWHNEFAKHKATVIWGNEWEYNEEGMPVLK